MKNYYYYWPNVCMEKVMKRNRWRSGYEDEKNGKTRNSTLFQVSLYTLITHLRDTEPKKQTGETLKASHVFALVIINNVGRQLLISTETECASQTRYLTFFLILQLWLKPNTKKWESEHICIYKRWEVSAKYLFCRPNCHCVYACLVRG